MQVVLPLGKEPGKRAGQQPERDSQAFPLKGEIVECVTGESVVVRRKPDLDALRQALQVLPLAPAICGAGMILGRWDSTACWLPLQTSLAGCCRLQPQAHPAGRAYPLSCI